MLNVDTCYKKNIKYLTVDQYVQTKVCHKEIIVTWSCGKKKAH